VVVASCIGLAITEQATSGMNAPQRLKPYHFQPLKIKEGLEPMKQKLTKRYMWRVEWFSNNTNRNVSSDGGPYESLRNVRKVVRHVKQHLVERGDRVLDSKITPCLCPVSQQTNEGVERIFRERAKAIETGELVI
jgi:hypothetical protein